MRGEGGGLLTAIGLQPFALDALADAAERPDGGAVDLDADAAGVVDYETGAFGGEPLETLTGIHEASVARLAVDKDLNADVHLSSEAKTKIVNIGDGGGVAGLEGGNQGQRGSFDGGGGGGRGGGFDGTGGYVIANKDVHGDDDNNKRADEHADRPQGGTAIVADGGVGVGHVFDTGYAGLGVISVEGGVGVEIERTGVAADVAGDVNGGGQGLEVVIFELAKDVDADAGASGDLLDRDVALLPPAAKDRAHGAGMLVLVHKGLRGEDGEAEGGDRFNVDAKIANLGAIVDGAEVAFEDRGHVVLKGLSGIGALLNEQFLALHFKKVGEVLGDDIGDGGFGICVKSVADPGAAVLDTVAEVDLNGIEEGLVTGAEEGLSGNPAVDGGDVLAAGEGDGPGPEPTGAVDGDGAGNFDAVDGDPGETGSGEVIERAGIGPGAVGTDDLEIVGADAKETGGEEDGYGGEDAPDYPQNAG